jgi:hypothetical protein
MHPSLYAELSMPDGCRTVAARPGRAASPVVFFFSLPFCFLCWTPQSSTADSTCINKRSDCVQIHMQSGSEVQPSS